MDKDIIIDGKVLESTVKGPCNVQEGSCSLEAEVEMRCTERGIIGQGAPVRALPEIIRR